MAAAVILDFQNLKFLTFGTVKRVEQSNRAKFCRNRSRYGDFSIFQDGGRRHGFSKFEIFLHLLRSRVSNCITVPNFIKIAPTAAEISRFFHFSRWRRQDGGRRHLGF